MRPNPRMSRIVMAAAVRDDWGVSAMSLLPESRCANRCHASLSTLYRGDSIEGVDAGEAGIATALNCFARILSVPINVGTNTWMGAIMDVPVIGANQSSMSRLPAIYLTTMLSVR